MIAPPADVRLAMARREIRKRLRVVWTLNDGTVIDLSTRIPRVSAFQYTTTLLPALGGYRVPSISLQIRNDDGALRPFDSSTLLGARLPRAYMNSNITIEQAVWGDTTGWYYFPVAALRLYDLVERGGLLDVKLEDALGRAARAYLPESVDITPAQSGVEWAQDLLVEHTPYESGDFDPYTFGEASGLQGALRWDVAGRAEEGSSVLDVAQALARTAVGTIVPREDGTLVFLSELPRSWGSFASLYQQAPDVLDESNAWDFEVQRRDSEATEVLVKFQDISAAYVDFDAEAARGYKTVLPVDALFVQPYRHAAWMARYLYSGVSDAAEAVKFTTHGLGLMMQLGDRVLVRRRTFDAPRLYRIMSKTWTREAVTIEAQRDLAHGIITAAPGALAVWNATDWDDSNAPCV